MESLSGSGSGTTFYGTIQHPAGNISLFLLQEGYAKVVDWNLSVVGTESAKAYKAAEASAKQKKLRIWKNATALPESESRSAEFAAIVTKIIGPDMLVVESVKAPGVERKIQLSSTRGPKRQKNELGQDIGYYTDAFEFLRTKLVGTKVLVKVDYIKPAEGEFERRECATVTRKLLIHRF